MLEHISEKAEVQNKWILSSLIVAASKIAK
jgi:hypothetical protein